MLQAMKVLESTRNDLLNSEEHIPLKDLSSADEEERKLQNPATKDTFRSQMYRIKETINKELKEDTTLGDRLSTLFREQGITKISILTAIGYDHRC